MKYVKWTLIALFWLIVGAFLHYTLPQTDIVRITGTYEDRIDISDQSWAWAGSVSTTPGASPERLIFFIQTRRADGDVMVYRNEDTGWGWPPFFKFDTANLQAEAADLVSTADTPRWVAIRHYGWRNEFISIFPNAVSLRPVDGPNVTLIPWMNIVILLVLAALVWAFYVRWKRFWERRVAPTLDRVF